MLVTWAVEHKQFPDCNIILSLSEFREGFFVKFYWRVIIIKSCLTDNFIFEAMTTKPFINDPSDVVRSKYFTRSKALYRYSAFIFLWILAYTQLAKAIITNELINSIMIALPALALYIITPLGIFYYIKSYAAKEHYNKYRAFYLFGHLFFLFILLAMIASVYLDFLKFRPDL